MKKQYPKKKTDYDMPLTLKSNLEHLKKSEKKLISKFKSIQKKTNADIGRRTGVSFMDPIMNNLNEQMTRNKSSWVRHNSQGHVSKATSVNNSQMQTPKGSTSMMSRSNLPQIRTNFQMRGGSVIEEDPDQLHSYLSLT